MNKVNDFSHIFLLNLQQIEFYFLLCCKNHILCLIYFCLRDYKFVMFALLPHSIDKVKYQLLFYLLNF